MRLLPPSAQEEARHLRSLGTAQSNRLSILLQLRNQLIALLYHIDVLLVLVIWTVSLDYALSGDAINRAWNSFRGDEFREVTMEWSVMESWDDQGSPYRSKKSTETPNWLAILSSPTTL